MRTSQAILLFTVTLAVAAGCGDETSSSAGTQGAGASGAGGAATGGMASTGGMTSTGGTMATGGMGGDASGSGGSGGALAFSFFVTSEGTGANGGNLGGLTGADAICQGLADAAGVGAGTWRAYLSTTAENARDRIGTGPWMNFDGDVIAADVDALHTDGVSNGNPQQIMDESGVVAPVNEHDIFTGSEADGTLFADSTCLDWTSSANQNLARVGHSDIPTNPNFSPSWNSAHETVDCTQGGIAQRGGSGRLYCFAL